MQSYAFSGFNPSILPFFNPSSCGVYTKFAAEMANLAITVATPSIQISAVLTKRRSGATKHSLQDLTGNVMVNSVYSSLTDSTLMSPPWFWMISRLR